MSNENNKNNRVAELVEKSNSIAIIPSKVAGLDAYCAGAAVYYMLRGLDKSVSFIYPGKIPENGAGVVKRDDITTDIGKRSLLVSIDYSGTEASKVHYSTEDDVLHLKISPVPADFNKNEKIKAKVAGFDFDIIFVIGAQNVLDLGHTYRSLGISSKASKIVNIDITERNERFGLVNIVDNSINSLSHLVLKKSPSWGLNLPGRSAKALLKGIISKETPHIS